MDRGYVKIWRKIQDEGWYTEPLTCHLAIHLILKANHRDKKFIWNKQEINIRRGQLITGRDKLSKETGLTPRNIRTSLATLKNCEFLTSKTTNKFSIITICNYDQYQNKILASDQQNDQQVTSKRPASDHKQELKNDKNEKNTYMSFFEKLWKLYPARKNKKVGKEEALNYFLANFKEDQFLCLEKAVKNYANNQDIKDGIGVKDMIRFLKPTRGCNTASWQEWISLEDSQDMKEKWVKQANLKYRRMSEGLTPKEQAKLRADIAKEFKISVEDIK